jgi:hypothetical protein
VKAGDIMKHEASSRALTVTQDAAGRWLVTDGRRVLGPFASNAAAWRFVDRHEGEPVSRSEETTDWLWGQQ